MEREEESSFCCRPAPSYSESPAVNLDVMVLPLMATRFEAVNKVEMHFLRVLHRLKQPEIIGNRTDPVTRWGGSAEDGVPEINVLAAWKVTNSPALNAYLRLAARVAVSGDYWVKTIQDAGEAEGLQKNLRDNQLTLNNEYWMLYGAKPEDLPSIFNKGLPNSVDTRASTTFGPGIYLADAVDKIDQQLVPDDELKHLSVLVGRYDEELKKVQAARGRVCVSLVARASLGRHVEVQLAESVKQMNLDKKDVGSRSDYYWHDPYEAGSIGSKRQTLVALGHPFHEKRRPPHNHPYDSVKVMCSRYNPDYSSQWAQRVFPDKPVTNAYPSHFNEYVVPFPKEANEPQHAAIQYVVAYERVRRQDSMGGVMYVGA